VVPSRAARSWAGRLAVLAVGLVALAVGAGLGLRHYAAEGWGPPAVVGLLLLAGGLVCSGWATFRLLAALRRRWWPLALALLLVATYLSLWTLGQAVAASYAPRPDLGSRTPADLELAYRDVTFPSSDGVDLAGWYVPTRNGAAVALLHGAGSTRSDVLDQAAVLARHGYGVLLLDARGHGESAGRGMDFGWYGTADVSGAVDFLTRQSDVSPDRVGLVGLSMGGEEALGAAGTDERIAAVVAEGATARVAADKGYLAAYGVRGHVQQRIDAVTYWLTDLLSDAPEPPSLRHSVSVATTRPHPTSFLLITAGTVPDEARAAAFIRGSTSGTVQTWTVPGAGHTRGLATAPAAWGERVTSFLDHSLGEARR
jgi:dienelactone hydrolase